MLPSTVTIHHLENIKIIGQGYPTVNCNGTGALKFVSCNNVTIRELNWDKCGSNNNSTGIEFHNSCNFFLENCSIYNSTRQALILSKMSGNVYINNCSFTNNNQYGGDGAAVYYLPWSENQYINKLVIQTSSFSLNGPAQSIVYIDDCINGCSSNVYLQNSVFIGNKGVSLYISHNMLHISGDVLFKENTAIAAGGIYSNNSTVLFDDRSSVMFQRNTVETEGGAFYLINSIVNFGTTAIVEFDENNANQNGGTIVSRNSDIIFSGNSNVTFKNNRARNDGGAIYCKSPSQIVFVGNSSVTFSGNVANHGGAIYCKSSSQISFHGNSGVIFNGNKADRNGGAVSLFSSNIKFDGNSSITFNSNEVYDDGGAVGLLYFSNITFRGNSSVTFNGNTAYNDGGAVFCFSSDIIFDGNSSVKFDANEANSDGGAVYCDRESYVTFDGNSIVKFNYNKAHDDGGALNCESYSRITFDGNSSARFNDNEANYGGAVFCADFSRITFQCYSSVTFNDNKAYVHGGAVYCWESSDVIFDNSSMLIFINNRATINGGAIYFHQHCNVIFDGSVSVKFFSNGALNGGAITSITNSGVSITGYSMVIFCNNRVIHDGAAIYLADSSVFTFSQNSCIKFCNNTAEQKGGAVYLLNKAVLIIKGWSNITFHDNTAIHNGGALYLASQSTAEFKGNSTTSFEDNRATLNGGAIYSFNNCSIIFDEYSNATLYNNNGIFYGGGLFLHERVNIIFAGHSQITFYDNEATNGGGAMFINYYSTATFTEHSEIYFFNNTATHSGGTIHCDSQSTISLDGNTLIIFINSTAENGGVCSILQSSMLCAGYSSVMIAKNFADIGGAFYSAHSSICFKENASAKFADNNAKNGGAVYALQSSLIFTDNSSVNFTNSSVTESGGAIYISDNFTVIFQDNSHISFYHNTVNRYGGAIYGKFTHSSKSTIKFKTTDIDFFENNALRGSKVYVDIPKSCDDSCLQYSIIGANNNSFSSLRSYIDTPPKRLEFYDPATCIENDTNDNCDKYITRNIMLGQEIIIDACVRDYYDQPVDGTSFVLNGEGEDYQINGSHYVLVSCEGFRGIRIVGKEVTNTVNYSITMTSHDGSMSDLKTISLKLITELSPCHFGFHYDNDKKRCECYGENIVSCSGSTSSIKRGYWFGEINDNATVTLCPNNYCNFTCCETTNGYYQLSPGRTNQCNLQRYGPACGRCKEGYTLSFDSAECISVGKCTPGLTALIIISSMIYWIAIVILVFMMTYYYEGVSYLYAITYYYSVVDILLSNSLYTTQGLFTTVGILSSTAKLTPQFLGQLCLVQNMSGIDQQFIHYVHPLAVTMIVSFICFLTRISYRISAFVSKGIIHVICFLLLLSYTSVTTTSLLLLRSLTFHNLDKVYTYLSPDIEYFHGRHLPYILIAILCTIVIAIGLPLLLLLEPFLNSKINFTRIKPLLDQFQGCYKDKYRIFASYYMICRLVIITIVMTSSSNYNATQYLLIIANAVQALIHMTFRPYSSSLLNVFDGLILQLMIVVSMLPLVDSSNPDFLLAFIFILILLPVGTFLIMEIYLRKRKIKEITENCKPPQSENTESDVNGGLTIRNSSITESIIDEDCRRNAFICEM